MHSSLERERDCTVIEKLDVSARQVTEAPGVVGIGVFVGALGSGVSNASARATSSSEQSA